MYLIMCPFWVWIYKPLYYLRNNYPVVYKGVYMGEFTTYPEDVATFPSEALPFLLGYLPVLPGVPNLYGLASLYIRPPGVYGLPYEAHQIP